MSSLRLAVVGVGRMGLPIAGHLNRAGSLVTVHDSNADRMRLARGRGLKGVDSAAGAASEADVLLTVLPGAADCDSVMLGIDRVLESLRPGSCWLDLRTRHRFGHSRARGRSGQLADLSGLVNPLG